MSLRNNSATFLTILLAIGGCSGNERSSGSTRPGGSSGINIGGDNGGSSGGAVFNPGEGNEPEIDPDSECKRTLQVVYRDFRQSPNSPDFEAAFLGDVVRRKLVADRLGDDMKPQFLDSVGCPWNEQTPLDCANWQVDKPVIQSAESFKQWYNDVDGVNINIPKEMELTETPPGSGQYVFESQNFFPLEPDEGFGKTPNKNQNYHFTTEIHLKFGYVPRQKFKFKGDDDLWIFVNGRLALDLGSLHNPATGEIDFDKQAKELGISPNQTYTMDVFHAERHTDGSSFRIETNISCFTSVPIILR